MTQKDYRYLVNRFLFLVSNISDKEYQKRIWIRGEGPEVDSFDEAVCQLFPIIEDLVENPKKFKITSSQFEKTLEFYHKYDSFCDDNDYPEEFIDSVEWAEIIDLAKEVLKSF